MPRTAKAYSSRVSQQLEYVQQLIHRGAAAGVDIPAKHAVALVAPIQLQKDGSLPPGCPDLLHAVARTSHTLPPDLDALEARVGADATQLAQHEVPGRRSKTARRKYERALARIRRNLWATQTPAPFESKEFKALERAWHARGKDLAPLPVEPSYVDLMVDVAAQRWINRDDWILG